jgi:hypothetical protein
MGLKSLLLIMTCCTAAIDRPEGTGVDAARVDQRIRDWQPTKEERRFDDIGWAADIRAALKLAAMHQRPVFLFTYDGAGIATYRC